MMKLSKIASASVAAVLLTAAMAAFASSAAAVSSTTGWHYYNPPAIDFSNLVVEAAAGGGAGTAGAGSVDGTSNLRQALSESGLIVLRNVPGLSSVTTTDDDDTREEWGRAMVECLETIGTATDSANRNNLRPRIIRYEDGTVRTTLAFDPRKNSSSDDDSDSNSSSSSSVGNTGSDACEPFQLYRTKLQAAIDRAIERIATALDSSAVTTTVNPLLTRSSSSRFLHSNDDDDDYYRSLSSVVKHATLIDHFHSYAAPTAAAAAATTAKPTIEMHTDLGLFVAFLPGRIVTSTTATAATTTEVARGFFIELRDGSVAEVVFDDNTNDDLVIMLGVEAERILNNKQSDENLPFLRAPPHSLKIETKDNNPNGDGFADEEKNHEYRVWYGRMVLPPADAHVVNRLEGDEQADDGREKIMTYGELRRRMIAASAAGGLEEMADFDNDHGNNNNDNLTGALRIGCQTSFSSTTATARVARELQQNCLENEELYCWHKCMPVSDPSTISNQACAERNLSLQCVQQGTGQLWNGDHADASYQPACYDMKQQQQQPQQQDGGEPTSGKGMDSSHALMDTPPAESTKSAAATKTTTTTIFFGGNSSTLMLSSLLTLLAVIAGV